MAEQKRSRYRMKEIWNDSSIRFDTFIQWKFRLVTKSLYFVLHFPRDSISQPITYLLIGPEIFVHNSIENDEN